MTKRLLGIFLALVMSFSAVCTGGMTAFAAEENPDATQEPTYSEEPKEEPTEDPTEPSEPEEPTEPSEPEDPTEPSEPEETGMKTSDDCIDILKQEEGFSKKPYWDYTQYTVGYGTKCPDDKLDYYLTYGITEEEAEILLRDYLVKAEEELNAFMEKHQLTWNQNQFDAVLLFSYNCGTGWCYDSSGAFYQALVNGATDNDLIRAFALWCSAGNQIQSYLFRRRLSEANMYLNGVYSKTPPEHYCYVIYDANSGYSKPRSQGYSSEWPVEPFPVPTHAVYTFDGWYTAKIGGTKITKLDQSTKGMTFYAHWKDAEGNVVEIIEEEVIVTVTGNDVNLRSGPGTNYASIGKKAKKDEKLTIVETSAGIGYTWGKFTEYGGGWICLQYTNYEEALKNGGNTDEPENPDTPENPKPLTGTIKVNTTLRIRSGPGTNYSTVGELKRGERVQILEMKQVGAYTWGRIESGWISMDYVELDKEDPAEPEDPVEPQPPVEPEDPVEPQPPAEPEDPVEPEKPQTQMGTINVNYSLRVRSGPGTNYVNGTTWGKTDKGWVSMYYVKLDPVSEPEKPQEPEKPVEPEKPAGQTGTIVNCNEWINIRSGAGTNYALAGRYNRGEKVTVTEQKTVNGTTWGKTDKGWVSMYYVKLDPVSEGGNAGGNTSNSWTGRIYNCTDWVRIRSGAGTGYSQVGYYYPGDVVTVTETKTNGGITWAKTEKGWVSMDYIKRDDSAQPKITMMIVADYLNIRSGAGTGYSVVGHLIYGNKVEVLETKKVGGATWGRISVGWICVDYAKQV